MNKAILTKRLLFFSALLIAISSFRMTPVSGQTPMYLHYQAIVTDAEGNPVTGTVAVRASIRQYTDDGTVIYSERQAEEADENGLVTLQVGMGEDDDVYVGDFESIDWADGPYFIQTEISPTGSYSYSLSVVSPINYVPLAMYAAKAESVVDDFVEADPNFYASVASEITAEDTARWNGLSKKARFAIGDLYEGGVIFYVDPEGEHGLIATLSDLETDFPWGTSGQVSGAESFYDGATNTTAIVADQGVGNAAYACDTLTAGGFDDWYLPSLDELQLLFRSGYVIDKILDSDGDDGTMPLGSDHYWTSTEQDADNAYLLQYGNAAVFPKETEAFIRAIRAF